MLYFPQILWVPTLTQALPTFHCKVKELLVLWEGLGGKGHSGAELWVVKLTGSEQEPLTELYVAYTLEMDTWNWVIHLLTRLERTASAITLDYQSIHDTVHQWQISHKTVAICFTWYKYPNKCTAEEESYSILCTNSHCPLGYHHLFFLPREIISLATVSFCTLCKKCSSEDNKAWTHN